MAHHTIYYPSTYVFVHGSAGGGAQWGPMAALLRPGECCLSGPGRLPIRSVL